MGVAAQASASESIGYASWLEPRALCVPPLVVRETTQHTGTRIWAASWLQRRWALENPDIFPPHTTVHELGAGCGLLGLSVAAAHGVHVTLSDFHGHSTGPEEESVLYNLRLNAARNRPLVRQCGGEVRVVDLDWARPEVALQYTEAALADAPSGGRPFEPLERAEVVLATEVLYTETGMQRTRISRIKPPHGYGRMRPHSPRSTKAPEGFCLTV